ncbi:MAG: hypothetical protein KGJ89_05470 [Patescibacteria group bacterium]|nr:hypothetical protein [Patescibacteria group bacterium]MDE2227371.1 hypothetical protein [Patescibacteria group bacterium]
MEKALYYSEFSEAQTWRDLLDNPFVGEPGRINANLEKAGLPTIDELELDEDLPDDQWSDCLTLDEAAEECGFEYEGEAEDHEDEISRAYADYGVELCGKFQEKINTIIEDYLRQIDQEHGTDYCPSGDLRVF